MGGALWMNSSRMRTGSGWSRNWCFPRKPPSDRDAMEQKIPELISCSEVSTGAGHMALEWCSRSYPDGYFLILINDRAGYIHIPLMNQILSEIIGTPSYDSIGGHEGLNIIST